MVQVSREVSAMRAGILIRGIIFKFYNIFFDGWDVWDVRSI